MPDDIKTKYIPFSDQDEFLAHYGNSLEHPKETLDFFYRFLDGMWIRSKRSKIMCLIVSIRSSGVFIGGIDFKIDWFNLYLNFEFIDGNPCGKEVKDV